MVDIADFCLLPFGQGSVMVRFPAEMVSRRMKRPLGTGSTSISPVVSDLKGRRQNEAKVNCGLWGLEAGTPQWLGADHLTLW